MFEGIKTRNGLEEEELNSRRELTHQTRNTDKKHEGAVVEGGPKTRLAALLVLRYPRIDQHAYFDWPHMPGEIDPQGAIRAPHSLSVGVHEGSKPR